MKLTVNIDDLSKAISSMETILTDSLIAEEQRNLIFWYNNGKLQVVAHNEFVNCICGTEPVNIEADDDEMVNIRYKELKGVLDSFKSLKVTEATTISFDFQTNCIKVEVVEEPLDKDSEFADKLYRTSKFTLSKPRNVVQKVKSEIIGVTKAENAEPMTRDEMQPYFDTLLPTIKDINEGQGARLNFVGDYIFTSPQGYVTFMENLTKLRNCYVLGSVAKFMKSFIDLEDVTMVSQYEQNGAVVLTLENSMAIATIKGFSGERAFNTKKYETIPKQGVVLDKKYIIDVLRRFNKGEDIGVCFNREELVLTQKSVSLSIPYYNERLDDDFEQLSLNKQNVGRFSNYILAHKDFGELLFIYFEKKENRKWQVCFTDNYLVDVEVDGEPVKKHYWYTSVLF